MGSRVRHAIVPADPAPARFAQSRTAVMIVCHSLADGIAGLAVSPGDIMVGRIPLGIVAEAGRESAEQRAMP